MLPQDYARSGDAGLGLSVVFPPALCNIPLEENAIEFATIEWHAYPVPSFWLLVDGVGREERSVHISVEKELVALAGKPWPIEIADGIPRNEERSASRRVFVEDVHSTARSERNALQRSVMLSDEPI
jgi:hypothetical protein